MYKVKTYNALASEGLDLLAKQGYEYGPDVSNAEAILLRSQDLHDEPLPDSLLGIFRAGSGVNNVPVEACTQKGIAVFNAPGANANSVKELVLGAMISLSRNIQPALEWMKTIPSDDADKAIEANKKQFNGHEIAGKTIGIIGLGSIGSLVTQASLNLGLDVIGYDPGLKPGAIISSSKLFNRVDSPEEVFKQADIITFHVPLTPQTKHLVNEETLALSKPGLILINYARAGIVDAQAVAKYIESGHIQAFASDFYEADLASYDNVYLTPHLGASTAEAQVNAVVMAAKSLILYLETGEVQNSVNLPDVRLPFESPYRLAIINQNVPNMIAEIASQLGKLGINIDKLSNQAKGDIAYTLVDLSGEDLASKLPTIIADMEEKDGIIRLRLIEAQ